jgi:hypothetical protein
MEVMLEVEITSTGAPASRGALPAGALASTIAAGSISFGAEPVEPATTPELSECCELVRSPTFPEATRMTTTQPNKASVTTAIRNIAKNGNFAVAADLLC